MAGTNKYAKLESNGSRICVDIFTKRKLFFFLKKNIINEKLLEMTTVFSSGKLAHSI